MTWHNLSIYLDKLLLDSIIEFTKRGLSLDAASISPRPASEEYRAAFDAEVDRHIRDFCATGSWPQAISLPAMHQCISRVHQARDAVGFLLQKATHLPADHHAVQIEI